MSRPNSSEKTANRNLLPEEVGFLVPEALIQDGCSLSNAAAVSREWQSIIEPHIFTRIMLTPSPPRPQPNKPSQSASSLHGARRIRLLEVQEQ
ncbi:unnamed protein product [Clonostachys solani]|uniref:F-box domain-containing protein n=1 Tax=Clonostachys solani TaxID=160281 RepID=A0A9P0ED54_9HYPO|nr:unnamed protein product [Clonostachys solani]